LILFVEPVSKNIGMYVPAYPLSLLEVSGYVKRNLPQANIQIISIPMDYGLPLNKSGKEKIYQDFFQDVDMLQPKGIGISCTSVSQAQEVILLCERIKTRNPELFVFLGGYFPSLYYKEIFIRTEDIDAIVLGAGEIPSLEIVRYLEQGKQVEKRKIPNLAWKTAGRIQLSPLRSEMDLGEKAPLNMSLLRRPRAYDILPYAFSRGCPYRCNFCMEEFIRPIRKEVPRKIVEKDLETLSSLSPSPTLLVADALFKSFDIFPKIRSAGMKANFETRCDVLDPSVLSRIADSCDMLALGFESASYDTLRRMNKVRDRSHYQAYITNTRKIFSEAVKNEIPIIVFMIAGYPGDTEKDLKESLDFVRELSKISGPGGYVFKIGECHVYPGTKIHDLAVSLPDVEFDEDGVFGQNIVRQPSRDLKFHTVLEYTQNIFNLSSSTPKFEKNFRNMMPFFRLPAEALNDPSIPNTCFSDSDRDIINVHGEHLSIFRRMAPQLADKYRQLVSAERKTRHLPL